MFSFFKSKPAVSLVRLNGVIGNVGRFSQGMSYASQSDIIKKAFALKNIKAVVISINSPGGSPVYSNMINQAIYQLKKANPKKPLYFVIEEK